MKYAIRSIKYLLFLCVLFVALTWLSTLSFPAEAGVEWQSYLLAQVKSERGLWLIVGIVALALFYPRFGFVNFVVEGCNLQEDAVRIDNAMQLHGFTLIEEKEGAKVYRAVGLLHRIGMMFEDRIEVRATERGVTISGLRRPAVRIGYQLRSYVENSRFEKR